MSLFLFVVINVVALDVSDLFAEGWSTFTVFVVADKLVFNLDTLNVCFFDDFQMLGIHFIFLVFFTKWILMPNLLEGL